MLQQQSHSRRDVENVDIKGRMNVIHSQYNLQSVYIQAQLSPTSSTAYTNR